MSDLRVQARADRKLKREYLRSCQLLGTSMSAQIHQTMVATIRKAKHQYPTAFNMLSDDEELIIEALESEQTTVFDVMMYTRFEKPRVIELLKGLMERGHVREEIARGSELRLYTIIRKNH